ncbi:MAG: hypothetical protein JW895_12160, partial [Thermoleophilaceae bacterium]|nr:hypothetical protein [Thermoleophilaceae bacterium]
IGLGLTLDEFDLWLNLEDVYWAPKGRQSIDAVIVTVALLALSLLGLQFWIDVYEAVLVLFGYGGERLDGGETAFILVPVQVAGVCLSAICFLKGKVMFAGIGLFIPIVALVGALRPAKPGSRWTRRRTAAAT